MQVVSHAQKFYKCLEAANKGNRRASILDIISVDAEAAGTSQVPNTEDMIWPACGGSQVAPNTSNVSMLPQESTNAEQQMITVAEGIDGLMTEQEDTTAVSSGTYNHAINGSELEALLAEPMDVDNDISSIYDVGKAPTSSYTAVEAAPSYLPPFAPSSNTPVDDEGIFDTDDLFTDQMF